MERAGAAWLRHDIRAAQAPRAPVHHIRWGEAHGSVPSPRLRGAGADAHGHRSAGAGDGGRLEGRRENGARDGRPHIVNLSVVHVVSVHVGDCAADLLRGMKGRGAIRPCHERDWRAGILHVLIVPVVRLYA